MLGRGTAGQGLGFGAPRVVVADDDVELGGRGASAAEPLGRGTGDVGRPGTCSTLALASIQGLIVRGPVAARNQAFALVKDWLGAPPQAMSRDAALGEVARRYLAGHAPAADRDLAQWAGIGLRDAGLGLAGCGAVQRQDGLAELPAELPAGRSASGRAAAVLPPPLLLGAFDPLLLGWASREPIVGPHRQIVTINGLFRPFALAGGRAVATWTFAGGEVTLAPFGPLDDQTLAALDAQAADVRRFLASAASAAS